MSVRLPGDAVAQALRHSTSGTDHYDERAFRYFEACPIHEQVPFETLARHSVRQQQKANLRLPEHVQALVEQEIDLAHRPIEPPSGQRLQFVVSDGLIQTRTPDGLTWVVPTSAPTPLFDGVAESRDVRPLFHVDEGLWLPLRELVDAGLFPRMQEIRDRLRVGARRGDLRVFVSHRWKSLSQPDPDAEQARTVAWRLFGALCQAVRVAQRRGLHTPRRTAGSIEVGPAGSPLAESIIVNVLRAVLNEERLEKAAAEVAHLGRHVDDLGAAQARSDTGLGELRSVLTTVPVLRRLIGHIQLWYDWSCMPQAPRTERETALFRAELARLKWRQASSHTLVLLDEVHDYLSRAWCHLEASFATRVDGMDVVWFDETPLRGMESRPNDLIRLVHCRQLVTWRALLDTEVLGRQVPLDCLRRLGLSAAEADDLAFIYGELRLLGEPATTDFPPNSLVTGTVPLPLVEEGRSMLTLFAEQEQADQPAARVLGSIYLMECLRINGPVDDVPSYQLLEPGVRQASCHVAVFASCEAEAVLISSRLRERLPELEKMLVVTVVSMSWLAIDPVPVGHRVDGGLRSAPVTADFWVLAGTAPRAMTAMYTQLLSDANATAITIDLRDNSENVSVLPTGLEWKSYLVATDNAPLPHPEGVLHHHFYSHLLQPKAPVHER